MPNERRKVPRYLAEVTAVLTDHESGLTHDVQVEVLSVQGCCLRSEGVPTQGKKCRLTFHWKGEGIRAEAQVVWKDGGGLSGLRFTSSDEETVARLRALCASLRLQPLTPWSAIENPHG